MESVITISLNGYPYQLTEDAYRALRSYLDALIDRFGQSNEAKETYEAIEARIGELLSERQKGNEPISLSTVNEVIAILGQPEDIDADQQRESASNARESSEESYERERNRMRLYRDVDSKIISGVCAGIAARLGTNAALIRLLFILGSLCYGIGIIVYIVLWAAVPPARTPLQKLRMQGKPITIDSIRTEANRSFQAARETLKGKNKNRSSDFAKSFENFLAFLAIGLVKLVVKILGVAFILAGAIGAIALTVLLGVALIGDASLADELFGSTTGSVIALLGWNISPYIIAIAIWGVCIVPLAAILIAGMRMLIEFRIAKVVSVTMLIFWIVSILVLATLTPFTYWRANKQITSCETEYEIPMRAQDTLRIDLRRIDNSSADSSFNISIAPRIDIRSTDDSIASIRIAYEALSTADEDEVSLEDLCAPSIDTASATIASIKTSLKKRNSPIPLSARAIIYLPEGTLIKFTPKAASKAEGYTERRTIRGKNLSKSVWQMRNGYLAPPSKPAKRTAPTHSGQEATPSPQGSPSIETTTAI